MIIDENGDEAQKIKESVAFSDVLLIPQYSEIMSRKTIDIGSNLSDSLHFSLPIISAPMDTVTESSMARTMAKQGGLGILHRYNTMYTQCNMASLSDGIVGAAVGITGDYVERTKQLVETGVSIICIDVAHGHHALVRHAIKVLRNTFGTAIHIMAGNVATLEGFNDLADWGADSIRVGIGGGSICSTRIQTGHGVPTLQSIMDCSTSDRPAKLIADGGIKNSGDIVKSLSAGADFVMIGSLLSGTTEAPGQVFHSKGKQYKTYRGMASAEAQIDWRGHTASLEGVSHAVPYKGMATDILSELERGIRSGFSYSGALNMSELHSKARFIKQTAAGQFESSTHIQARYK